jgi:hypothetical protein
MMHPDLADFCALIVTHRRPDRVFTLDQLKRCGYTGKTFLVVDDLDPTLPQYIERFGSDRVLVFSKAEQEKTTDDGDNFRTLRGVLYARNACFDLAEQVGYRYFIELDDDYTDFRYKFNARYEYGDWSIRDLDSVFAMLLRYFKASNALSIAMAQGGDFPGGANCATYRKRITPRRKAMNSFFCSTDRRFSFVGRINEDLTTTVEVGRRGGLFLTIPNVALQQVQTQANSGGLTELYLDAGTYMKSFYTVMYAPSCTSIHLMGAKHRRLHHQVNWSRAVPRIVRESLRKPRTE